MQCNYLQEKIKNIKADIKKIFSTEKENQIKLNFKNEIFTTIKDEIDNKFSKVIVKEQYDYLDTLRTIINSFNEEKFTFLNYLSKLTQNSNLKFEDIKENFLNISEKLDFFSSNLKTFEEINNKKLLQELKINNKNFLKLKEKIDDVISLLGGTDNIHETYNSLKKINNEYDIIYKKINKNTQSSNQQNIITDKLYILELFWIMFSFLLLILIIIIIIIMLKRRKNKQNNFLQDKMDHHHKKK
ncbi:hypothetical protein [Candidatus Phytoplasma palmae]|uniref:hypothetical protein n=1 Tax=Candidatus Phytoplasma palmae TaxID=85624 RepID=UPI0039906DD8